MEPEKDVAQEAVEETVQEQATEEPTAKDYLSDIPGSPTKDQIEEWKRQYGEVLCSGFTDLEIFVWRPLTRTEFISIQSEMAQQEGATQFDLEERLVAQCVLWASPVGVEALEKKAGSLPTLHEQIMQNSNFMNPAMAAALVVKL